MWHVMSLLRLLSQSTQIFQNSKEDPKACRQDQCISCATVVTLAKRRVKRPLHECCKIPHTRLLPCGCFSCQFAEGEKSLQRPIKERGKGRKISENPSRKIVGAVVSLDYRRTEQRRSPGQPRETVTAPIKFSI